MSVVIAFLYETDRLGAAKLRWPLRIATAHWGNLTFLVPATGAGAKATKFDLSDAAESDPDTHELCASRCDVSRRRSSPPRRFRSGRRAAGPSRDDPREPSGGHLGEDAAVRVTYRHETFLD